MANAKFEKIRTWPLSMIIWDQGHVLGNANFVPGRQSYVFTFTKSFFLQLQKVAFCEAKKFKKIVFMVLALHKSRELLMDTSLKCN